jgi:hypothetical protein
LKSFDILLMSASLRIAWLCCLVMMLESRDGTRRSLVAMVNTCILIKRPNLTWERLR